jgi:hypothetical protein
MNYKELRALPAAAYLDPSLFVSPFDALQSVKDGKPYEHGLETSRNAFEVVISVGSTWGASMRNGGSLTACEGIGYNSGTADLLRGFLDGPAAIVVHRWNAGDGPAIETTIVKPYSREYAIEHREALFRHFGHHRWLGGDDPARGFQLYEAWCAAVGEECDYQQFCARCPAVPYRH